MGDDVSDQGQSNFETITNSSNFVEAVYEHDSDDITRIKIEPNCENESDDISSPRSVQLRKCIWIWLKTLFENTLKLKMSLILLLWQWLYQGSYLLKIETRTQALWKNQKDLVMNLAIILSSHRMPMQLSGSYTNFRTLLDINRLTITQYQEEHGDMMVNELVHHKCKICDKLIKYERKPLENPI